LTINLVYHPAMVAGDSGHQGLWLFFYEEQVLLKPEMLAEPLRFPPWTTAPPRAEIQQSLILGTINGVSCRVASLKRVPAGWQALGIRDYLTLAHELQFKVINAASQLLYWLHTQNFCSRCGEKLAFDSQDRCLLCAHCDYRSYPKIAPCIIITIIRGDKILLAQSHRFRNDMYSCLAGFIECGENAEQAIDREVWEEVRVKVKNVRYIGSQAWPFPHQLMLGFVGEYQSGSIVKDDSELRAADWFRTDALPSIPPVQTIARTCIDKAITDIHCGRHCPR